MWGVITFVAFFLATYFDIFKIGKWLPSAYSPILPIIYIPIVLVLSIPIVVIFNLLKNLFDETKGLRRIKNLLINNSGVDFWKDSNGLDHQAINLEIQNDGEQIQINNLNADIEYILQRIILPTSITSSEIKIETLTYPWRQKNLLGNKSISLKPGDSFPFLLACFGNQSPPQVYFGINGYTELLFDKEAIYEFRILFRGKLEGETEFRDFLYKDIIYSDPMKRRLIIGRDAIGRYGDFSDLFKSVIEVFYKKPIYSSDYLRQQAQLPNEVRDAKFKRK